MEVTGTAGHVPATLMRFLWSPFLARKDVFFLNECIERLVQAGFSQKNAAEICKVYATRCDWDGLESFTCSCEQYDPLKVKEGETVGV